MEPDINPSIYVEAARLLINASRSADGPAFEDAVNIVAHLNVPHDWIKAILFGWADYHKRYKRPLIPQLASAQNIRYLSGRCFRVLGRTESKRRCTICGLAITAGRATSWHKQCFIEFEKSSSWGWKKICSAALTRAEAKCEKCKTDLLLPGIKCEYDHIVPVWQGGSNCLENVQVLCEPCHTEKTKIDTANWRAASKKSKNEQ
jgi:5-methylcytosine-specific restriction endonuclease McrA